MQEDSTPRGESRVTATARTPYDSSCNSPSKARATDIHVEPKGERHHVDFRVDGQMVAIIDLHPHVGELIYGLIKTACHIKIQARDSVQEGRFSPSSPIAALTSASVLPQRLRQKLIMPNPEYFRMLRA